MKTTYFEPCLECGETGKDFVEGDLYLVHNACYGTGKVKVRTDETLDEQNYGNESKLDNPESRRRSAINS